MSRLKHNKILFDDVIPGDVIIIGGIKSLVLSKSIWTNTIMVLCWGNERKIVEHYMKTGVVLVDHIDIELGLDSLCIRAGLDTKEIINH